MTTAESSLLVHDSHTGIRKTIAVCYGALCHLSFIAAVGTMMAAMFFGMGRSLGPFEPPWRWIANAVLLIQFPVVHSLSLTARGRATLTRLAPRGTGTALSTTTFATIAGLQIFALFAFWSPTGKLWWHAGGSALAVMTALYAASWLLLAKSMADAGLGLQIGSLGWVALFRGRKPVYPAMPVNGLFRFTRQPIYASFALTLWTVPTWSPDQLIVALTLTAYCLVGPVMKELRYRRIYGEAFHSYARTVPYWLPLPRRGR